MNPAPVLKLLLALTLFVMTAVFAQEDEVVERYLLAQENLTESRSRMLTDPEASNTELELAAAAIRYIAERAGRSDLSAAFEGAVARAEEATNNRSTPDHQIQTELLRAGLRKALFEATLAIWESDRPLANDRLAVLAQDLNSPIDRLGITDETGANQVRALVQAVAAESSAAALAQAPSPRPDLRAPTYRSLAGAYGHYLVLQDSEFADTRVDEGFAEAAQATVEGDSEAFAAIASELQVVLTEVAQAAREEAADSNSAETTNGQDGAITVLPLEAESADGDGSDLQAGVSEQDVPDEPAGESTASDSDSADTSVEDSETDDAIVNLPVIDDDQVAEVAPDNEAADNDPSIDVAEKDDPTSDDVTGNDVTANASTEEGPAAAAVLEGSESEANGPATAGVVPATNGEPAPAVSQEQAVTGLYSLAARYVLAIQEGRLQDADIYISQFGSAYRRGASDLVASRQPELDSRLLDLTATLSRSVQPRVADASALLVQVGEVERVLAGGTASPRSAWAAALTSGWSGWSRSIVMVVLGLLALLPLYLLNLAFGGGGNRNWRLVGAALLMLLSVLIYEGLRALLAIIAEAAGSPDLNILAPYSMVDTPIGQVVTVAFSVVAIFLASIGLYGICVQFGLIRGRRQQEDGRHTMVTRAATDGTDTVVDWDQEF